MSSHAADEASLDRVRLGVVGLGAVAQAVHLPLLDRLDDRFAIAGLCDLSPTLLERLGERYRVPSAARFTSTGALIAAGGLDALVILSSGSHGGLTIDALRAGLAVFVEKPLAFTLAEADAIIATGAADRVEVGYMKLWDPAVRRAAAAIERARAERGSRIRAIEVTVLHPSSERQLWQARLLPPPSDVPAGALDHLRAASTELTERALGGPAAGAIGSLYTDILLGSVVHELALVRAFAGDPQAIDAVDVWPAGAWPPSVSVAGRLPGDARLSIGWHYLPEYAAYREIVRVVLDDATVEVEFAAPYYLHAPTRLTVTEPDDEARRDAVTLSVREAFEEELVAFHALATSGTRPAASVAEGRADIVTCLRIARRFAEARGIAIGGEAGAIDAPQAARAAS